MPFGFNPGNITDTVNDAANNVTDTVNDTVDNVSGGGGGGGSSNDSGGSSGGNFGDIVEREQSEGDDGFQVGVGGGSFDPGDQTTTPDPVTTGGSSSDPWDSTGDHIFDGGNSGSSGGGSGGGSGAGNQQQQAMSPDEIQEMFQQQQQQFQEQLSSVFEGLGQTNSGGESDRTLLIAGAVAVGAVVLGVIS